MLVLAHFVALALLPLCAGALAVTLLLALVRRRGRLLARQGHLLQKAQREATPNVVQVEGRLVVPGEGLQETMRPGTKLAAKTAWLSKRWLSAPRRDESVRAPTLAILTKDGAVALTAAVTVEAGSELRASGRRLLTAKGRVAVADALLFEGDEVTAVGCFAKRPAGSDAGEYRSDATDRTLEPAGDEPAVPLVARAAPKVRVARKALLRHPAVLVSALACSCPGLWGAKQYLDTYCVNCFEDGRCRPTPVWRHDELGSALRRMLAGRHFTCAPASREDCERSTGCEARGACSLVDGRCGAGATEDCTHTLSCLNHGECTPRDGQCESVRAEDCLHTTACRLEGRCVPGDGRCVTSDEGCRQSSRCHGYGLCSALGATCVAASDEDCASSVACIRYEQCHADEDRCVVSLEDCRSNPACRQWGRCVPKGGICRVGTDADCKKSEACAEERSCRFDPTSGSECIEDSPRCRESAACSIWGRCSGTDRCKAESDADCAGSRVCQEDGACTAMDGACVASCADHPSCRRDGFCSERGGRCSVTSDEDCARSDVCRENGWCHAKGGACMAGANKSCERTRGCRMDGRCSATGRTCELLSSADCAKTLGCERDGACSRVGTRCAPARDEDCRDTQGCKVLGRCSAPSPSASASDAECMVAKDDDCRLSDVCKRFGWCSAVPNPRSSTADAKHAVCFFEPRATTR